ncbi:MAG: 30S ribosomal protein S6 [Candidatus Riesia sp.]|nr:30S ribosomal protein S6 [Candidatus Riesia sp.]
MKKYEIIILVHPNQSERLQDIIKKYKSMIENDSGKINNFEDMGKRQLAYQINKLHKAHYVLMNIECKKETLNNLVTSFKFNDAIIRSLIINDNNIQNK